jgi:hypothetical protein
MRSLLLALGFALALCAGALAQGGSPIGPPNTIGCDMIFQVSQAATARTKIVSGVTGQSISVCGWTYNSGAATSTATLSYGTGTNCGTNTAQIYPTISLPINGVYLDHVQWAVITLPIFAGVSSDLCLTSTGTGPANVTVYYSQQ